jgi:butyryl-CoA dehydrogenase
MATTISPLSRRKIAGGSFLIEETKPQDVFTPEDFSDEHRQIAQTADEFADNEIVPNADKIEHKDFEVTRALLKHAAELGLTSVDIPEAYGGLELDKATSAVIADRISRTGSFSTAFGAHAGIGTLPLVYFGTEEQKKKYLPKLAAGQWIAAYALSESSSGSDAMNSRTKATLAPDGKHYLLNGEKMWITNAGFANIFTVFAKVDGEKFTAFLVERTFPGLSIGAEEHKMGIRGSSTCPLILNDCQVPVENVLGEIGKGHHIAFNILNIGRFKLGAACVGGARQSVLHALKWAKDRKAFGKTISEFGLVREKIADMAVGVYAGEAMIYRTVGMMDVAQSEVDKSDVDAAKKLRAAIEEYAVECSIIKVWTSEMLDNLVDHCMQIYAGYGFVEEYPAERAYRDSRINRIFEGTNEINRLIITGWLLKRAMSGQLPLLPAIKKVMDEVMSGPSMGDEGDGPLAAESTIISNAKKLGLLVAGAASQKYMAAMPDHQEVMGAIADMVIDGFAMDCCLARTKKLVETQGEDASKIAIAMTQLYIADAITRIESAAKKVLADVAEGDMLRTQMSIVRRLTKHDPYNLIALQEKVAARTIEQGKFVTV